MWSDVARSTRMRTETLTYCKIQFRMNHCGIRPHLLRVGSCHVMLISLSSCLLNRIVYIFCPMVPLKECTTTMTGKHYTFSFLQPVKQPHGRCLGKISRTEVVLPSQGTSTVISDPPIMVLSCKDNLHVLARQFPSLRESTGCGANTESPVLRK